MQLLPWSRFTLPSSASSLDVSFSASGRALPTFAQRRQAHILEVLLCIFFCVVVRQSVAWGVFARDLVEINISRAYLLLEPELFHLQVLLFLHPRRAKMPFTAEESPLILTSIPELPADLRNTKNFATDLQRSIQFGLSTRPSGSPGELATSPITVGVHSQFSWRILPFV